MVIDQIERPTQFALSPITKRPGNSRDISISSIKHGSRWIWMIRSRRSKGNMQYSHSRYFAVICIAHHMGTIYLCLILMFHIHIHNIRAFSGWYQPFEYRSLPPVPLHGRNGISSNSASEPWFEYRYTYISDIKTYYK